MKAWHFCSIDKKLGYGDSRQIQSGRTIKVKFPNTNNNGDIFSLPTLCESGLHASVRLLDALKYAPGPIICRVELGGTIIKMLFQRLNVSLVEKWHLMIINQMQQNTRLEWLYRR